MTKIKKTEFQKWFKKQYGKTPMLDYKRRKMIDKVVELKNKISEYEFLLKTDNDLGIAWQAARYIWNTKNK